MTDENAGDDAILSQRTDRESSARTCPRHPPPPSFAVREARGFTVVERGRDERADGEAKAEVTA